MKKMNVINLIKYHTEKNEQGFRGEANEIAKYFDSIGDYQLSRYVISLLSGTNAFVPQADEGSSGDFLQKIEYSTDQFPLPEAITEDIIGMINAINHNIGMNKFMFVGSPGTGKTESVKHVARMLDRQLFKVNFHKLIDSKMGETTKNIVNVFDEINNALYPSKMLVLFDEIDAIALDRVNTSDLREMGRVTSAILGELDKLNDQVVIIATTNLFKKFDKALVRRFDSVIDFDRYNIEELIDVAESVVNKILVKFPNAKKDIKLFRKIIRKSDYVPYPGELTNYIKTSIAFSNPEDGYDYLKRFYKKMIGDLSEENIHNLYNEGFTTREIEVLTGVSKSKVSRELRGEDINE